MQERKKNVLKRKSIFIRMAVLVVPLMLLLLLSQTVFAQNTYIITDGNRVLVHTTFHTDPAAILNEAGLALDPDDTYTTQAGLGISEITVRRRQTVNVDYCGEQLQVAAYSETVGELLTRINIPVLDDTTVSAALDSVTYDGMALTISRSVRNQQTYTTPVSHETRYCYDSSLPKGETQVLTKGVDGQMLCTASVEYVNGRETNRTILSQLVTQQPVDEVIAVGTGANTPMPHKAQDAPIIKDGLIITGTGEVLTYTQELQTVGTAYSRDGRRCFTYSGTVVDLGSVAVDPAVIPIGTRMFIVSNDGEYVYGIATAEDIGYGVDGYRVDLYMATTEEALQFGRRPCKVYILGEAEIVREDI